MNLGFNLRIRRRYFRINLVLVSFNIGVPLPVKAKFYNNIF